MVTTRLRTTAVVVVLVMVVAGGLFALQFSQAQAQCSLLPGSPPCGQLPAARIALDGFFVAIAGLVVAVAMALATGIKWRSSPAPNTLLAERLDEEQQAFKREQARRSELAQLNALARTHAATLTQAHAEMAAAEAEEAARASAAAASGPRWQLEEEPNTTESPEQARRRVLADRLKTLAKNRPETVAGVLQVWINQPRPRGR